MDPSFRVACLFPEGSADLLCTGTSSYASLIFPSLLAVSCEAMAPVHQCRSAFPCILLHMFCRAPVPVHALGLCWLPVQSAVFWGPPACGSLVFVVVFVRIVMHTCHTPIRVPSCQQCFTRHSCQCVGQGSAFPCISLCSFMQLRLCMPLASIGKPVNSAVCCCPHVRGSLGLVVVSGSLFLVVCG